MPASERSPMNPSRVIGLLAIAMLASACTDQPKPDESTYVAAPAATIEPASDDWLAVSDKTPPERWLIAHRLAGAPASDNDEVLIRELLAAASRRFQENPRMIANRAVQLQTMLTDAGIAEDAIDLIRRFLTLPERTELRGFSANCQHYFNLRQQGRDAAAALAALSSG